MISAAKQVFRDLANVYYSDAVTFVDRGLAVATVISLMFLAYVASLVWTTPPFWTLHTAVTSEELLNEQTSYVPDIADLMIITQERFTKLSYAAETNNWGHAAYEVAGLRKAYDDAVRFYPFFADVQPEKLEATDALNAIDKAIASKDLPGFVEAFNNLKDACNSCHLKARVGFAKVPELSQKP